MGPIHVLSVSIAALVAVAPRSAGAPSSALRQADSTRQAARPTVAEGDPVRGRGLFTGAIRFRNGGPPCMACHSVAGIGALGGGALGPDLTPAHEKYGAEGLAAVLANIPFPTMQPIFTAHPLEAEEQARLITFLRDARAERPVRAVGQLSLLAVAGALVLIAPLRLFGRRRLTEVRRPMVRRASRAAQGVRS